MNLEQRIALTLAYGLDPHCEVVNPQRALVFACQLVIDHHDAIEGKKLLAGPVAV